MVAQANNSKTYKNTTDKKEKKITVSLYVYTQTKALKNLCRVSLKPSSNYGDIA